MVPFYRRDLLIVVLSSPHPSQPEHDGGKAKPLFKKKTYRLPTVLAGTLASFLGLPCALSLQAGPLVLETWLFSVLKAATRMGSREAIC